MNMTTMQSNHILYALVLLLVLLTADLADAQNNWSLYGANYQNHRHSALTQINTDTIAGLTLAWRVKTGKIGSFQASPLVVDGVMYISTPFNDVLALEASSGAVKWRYRHQLASSKACCGPANRGVALAKGTIFQATIDGRLIALDQLTGKVLWDHAIKDTTVNIADGLASRFQTVEDDQLNASDIVGHTGLSFNMAPQVYNGMVFVGSTGAGYGLHLNTEDGLSVVGQGETKNGLRGFIAAFDIRTGREIWRWYSVSGADWVGDWRTHTESGVALNRDIPQEKKAFQRFPNTWQLGGGSIWTTPAIDTETGVLYLGTGNPAPNMESSTRPGDNTHTASIVALDSRTGELLWSHQQVPHDRWGYDVASPVVLFDINYRGQSRAALGQAGKTGWFYIIDRKTGELITKSEAFVPQHNLFKNPNPDGVYIYPAIDGGSNWSPVAYNPMAQHAYISGVHIPATYYQKKIASEPDKPWSSYTYFKLDHKNKYGLLSAVDVSSGKILWQHKTPNPLIGGALHTAGDLVFTGEGSGEFFAVDARNGKKLWSFKTEYGVNAPPVSFQIEGQQYIAVAAGGNKLHGYPVGDEILVFKLADD